MSTPTRSCRQMIGRNPPATAVSITDVVGKQNSVVTPSRFRISTTAWSARICSLPCGVCPSLGAGRRTRLQSGRLAAKQRETSMQTSISRRAYAGRRRGRGSACRAARAPRTSRSASACSPTWPAPMRPIPAPARYSARRWRSRTSCATNPSIKAEVVQADLQLKPDVAVVDRRATGSTTRASMWSPTCRCPRRHSRSATW